MMTPEENREIVDYLFSKKLPLDLLVEVEDHMKEQISVEMENGKPFEEAFALAKQFWAKDLEMRWMLFRGKVTRLERAAYRALDRNKNGTVLKFVLPFMALVIFLAFKNPDLAKWLLLVGNFIVGIISLYLIVFNFKLYKTTSNNFNRRNISILQRKATLLFIGVEGLFFSFINPDKFCDNFQQAVYHFPKIKISEFLSMLFPFLFIYGGAIGILYFIDYKKAVEILKQKINFKL